MFQKQYFGLILFTLYLVPLSAQNKVQELTASIVDTSQSELIQAYQIYNWITHNITYDVRSFQKFEYLNYSTNEILSKRKGLCDEFSRLFRDMCQAVDIEAYCISGYAKNINYYKNKPFLRAEHSWNVFLYDSVWHFVDASYGTGIIYADAHWYRKILNKVLKIPAPKNKLKFSSNPDSGWFNIPAGELILTHYPLDPMWFQNPQPYSFSSFEIDSIKDRTDYPDYAQQIESISGKSEEKILKAEGINGIKFNTRNYFDLAHGYIADLSLYDIERDINNSNLWQFEKYSSEYEIAQNALKKHLSLNDSIYRVRKSSLKKLSTGQRRITDKIDRKARSSKKSFRTGYKSIVGKTSSFRRKQESYMLKGERLKIKKISPPLQKDSIKVDKEKINNLYADLNEIKTSENYFEEKADSLFLDVDYQILNDVKLDDSIHKKNYVFTDIILKLDRYNKSYKEDSIRIFVDSLYSVYKDIGDLLTLKKNAKQTLKNKSKDYYSYAGEFQNNLRKQITVLNKIYKVSDYCDSIREKHNNLIDSTVNSYLQSMKYTRKMENHNMLQADERKINLKALKYQQKMIKREYRDFNSWFSVIYENETNKYFREKEIAKTLLTFAQQNKRTVDYKLKKYNDQLKKSSEQ